MPGALDGVAVGRCLRARRAEVPVIYVTGRPDSMLTASLRRRDAFMRKPYGPRDMMALVSRVLAA